MTYITNSLTSANPAADLYTAMAAALSSAGFTLVDTVVISTRTHKVWKCAAANNAHGLDWYLDVAYTTTGAGHIWLGMFEDYNATTHVGYRGIYNSTADTNNAEATYYSRYGATGYALETNWTTVTNNVSVIQTQISNFAYWISITGDRVIAMTSVRPTDVIYVGMFDPYTPWANKIGGLLFPLIACTINSPSSEGGSEISYVSAMNLPPTVGSSADPASLTRHPPITSLLQSAAYRYNNVNIYTAYNPGPNSTTSRPQGSGYGGANGFVDTLTNDYYDIPRGGKLIVAVTWADRYNVTIGTLKDILLFAAQAVTRGDTVTITGSDWVLSGQNSNRVFGFKAA